MITTGYKYIGKGIYTIPDASKLTRVSSQRIRNWIRSRMNNHVSSVLVETDYGITKGNYGLSFHDMIEILTIGAFRKYGVSLQLIRKVHSKSCEDFNTSHPFAINRFWTDGKDIWLDMAKTSNDAKLIHILSDQIELRKITLGFLDLIDFTDDGVSYRWWPLNRDDHVVIDPRRSFGQPVVKKEGVPTIVLANAVKAEDSIDKVAKWYEVDPLAIESAYRYETTYTNRLAA